MGSVRDSTTDETAIKALIDSLKNSLAEYDSTGALDRFKLKSTAVKLSLALETPGDTTQRIAYYPVRTAVVRACNRLDVFRTLSDSPHPIGVDELAQKVSADPGLLRRLLRYLASMYAVGEAGQDLYFATNITRNLAIPGFKAGIDHTFDTVGPPVMAIPSFLRKTNHRNPSNVVECPFQEAFNTKQTAFEWIPHHQENLDNFNTWMTAQRDGRAYWLDFFPFEEQIAQEFASAEKDDAVLVVDIGGGRGHELQAIKSRYPHLHGKFILQDLPQTVAQAHDVPDIVKMPHDFFSEQKVKGARCYYLRNVLHDWPDDECIQILSQIAKAMEPGYSKILLNEMIVPDVGAEIVATQLDMIMMACFASCERTVSHWRQLIEQAGLKMEKIWTEKADSESVIEVIL